MSGNRIAYLTIDDGPSTFMSKKVEFLIERDIPAVFFCCGKALEEREGMALDAIKNGFIIGNHSYSHAGFSTISVEQGIQEIIRTDKIINDIYEKAGVDRTNRYFRFPFGDKGGLNGPNVFAAYSEEGLARKKAFQECLYELGYVQFDLAGITYPFLDDYGLTNDIDCYWTYDVLDWSITSDNPLHGIDSLEKAFLRMDEDDPLNQKGLNSGDSREIILMHDQEENDKYFYSLVAQLQDVKGLKFSLPK